MWEERGGRMSACMISRIGSEAGVSCADLRVTINAEGDGHAGIEMVVIGAAFWI